MENIFTQYFFKDTIPDLMLKKEYGPVVTISRETGSMGTTFACGLTKELNRRLSKKSQIPLWKVINKEIIQDSAIELHSNPGLISHVFNAQSRGFYADIIASFSGKYYISDERIKSTIKKVIRRFGEEGNAVIVGRAGFLFTNHIKKSLHIKLIAPYDMRIKNFANKFILNENEAKQKVDDTDNKRKRFLQIFEENIVDNDYYDVVFNLKNFNIENLVDTTMKLMESKKLID